MCKKPYKCNVCNYTCSVKSSLTRHKKFILGKTHIDVVCVIMNAPTNIILQDIKNSYWEKTI
jgi:transposase-like protein